MENKFSCCFHDLGGNWNDHLYLVGFVHDESYHKKIDMAPYGVLYGGHVGCLYIGTRLDKHVIIGVGKNALKALFLFVTYSFI